MTVTVLNAHYRPALEERLPDWVEPLWFKTTAELLELAPRAEIGWFDASDWRAMNEAVMRAENLRWLTTVAAGVDSFPLEVMRERGVLFTSGVGLKAVALAEYAVLGMLVIAKGYREVARAQERKEWLRNAPGRQEVSGSRLLIVGAGAIGSHLAGMLRPWDVEITEVRRTPAPGVLGPDEWRARLGEFDWVALFVPSTPETKRMFGEAEFAAMKPGAALLNFARGVVVDQDALIAAIRSGHLGAAFLDVTDPEPLPSDHPLWGFDNVHVTSHLSGRTQTTQSREVTARFLRNLDRYRQGEELEALVDLDLGY